MAMRVERVRVPSEGRFAAGFKDEDRGKEFRVVGKKPGVEAKDTVWLTLERDDGTEVEGPYGNVRFSDNWVEKVSNGP